MQSDETTTFVHSKFQESFQWNEITDGSKLKTEYCEFRWKISTNQIQLFSHKSDNRLIQFGRMYLSHGI